MVPVSLANFVNSTKSLWIHSSLLGPLRAAWDLRGFPLGSRLRVGKIDWAAESRALLGENIRGVKVKGLFENVKNQKRTENPKRKKWEQSYGAGRNRGRLLKVASGGGQGRKLGRGNHCRGIPHLESLDGNRWDPIHRRPENFSTNRRGYVCLGRV